MVKITELDDKIISKITHDNGKKLNKQILDTYLQIYKDSSKRDYELTKCRLDLERLRENNKYKNERDKLKNRYYLAKNVVYSINKLGVRHDNYIRFLSILLLLSGGSISYVCYSNTDSVYKSLNNVYTSIESNILANSTDFYNNWSFNENGFMYGYMAVIINSVFRILLVAIDSIKYILLSLLGIVLGITQIGSIALSSIIMFMIIIMTMCMVKLMNSSISIGIGGISINESNYIVNVDSYGDTIKKYFET